MVDQEIASLHSVFVIIYLQEIAWISAPLLISANVFLHACIRGMELEVLLVTGGIFGFFLLSGISLGVSLYIIHSRALGRKQPRYLSPYIINKVFRILVLGILSIVILVSPALIKVYFYAAVYGMFECVAGIVALEFRVICMRELIDLHAKAPEIENVSTKPEICKYAYRSELMAVTGLRYYSRKEQTFDDKDIHEVSLNCSELA